MLQKLFLFCLLFCLSGATAVYGDSINENLSKRGYIKHHDVELADIAATFPVKLRPQDIWSDWPFPPGLERAANVNHGHLKSHPARKEKKHNNGPFGVETVDVTVLTIDIEGPAQTSDGTLLTSTDPIVAQEVPESNSFVLLAIGMVLVARLHRRLRSINLDGTA